MSYIIDPALLANPGTKEILAGPWKCEKCEELSQYAVIRASINRVFCKNCDFERIIDKRHMRVIEADGTHWEYDNRGNKRQVTGQ